MSTATRVPETHQLEGDDALNALRRTGWGRLAKDSFQRFRAADGFSHSRALAFQITFTLLPGIIAVVGLATILHAAKFRDILRQTVTRLAPGPAGDIVVAAFKQGERTVGGGARAALLFGAVATLISAATAMGQIERGANRIYGVEQDRPPLKKYGVGVLLACTTGLLMTLAFVLIVAGADIAKAAKLSGVAWEVARWPLSILFLVVAVALLFKAAPKRRQPAASWLAVGSAMSVLLWFAFTGLLALYLGLSKTFGQTYGPLAGMIGILAWALLTSLAAFLGLAFAAQLEAVRAGVPGPATGQQANSQGRARHRRVVLR